MDENMRRRFVIFGLLLALAIPARATVLVPADLGELSRDAVVIARGQVTSVEARWAEDRRTIETIVTLDVERYLKGAFGSTLQFRVPGGELGRFRSIVVGAPEFAVDDHVVVFLGARGPSVPYVVGFSQGVFRLARAAGSSGWIVTSPTLFPAASGTVKVVRGDATRGAMPAADFEQRVRALVAGAR
jgi:hypothetical protein